MFDVISSVLPRHSSELERALEQASLWVIRQSEIVDVWNPETAPAKFLPWLAWSVSVDEWNPYWTDQKKRRVIRESVAVHRLKGTKGAVRRALEAMGFSIDIIEWFEDQGDVHTFKINVFADSIEGTEYPISSDLIEIVSRQIDHVKPVRSHYQLGVGERFRAKHQISAGVYQRLKSSGEFIAEPRVQSLVTVCGIRGGASLRLVSRHEHLCERSGNG